MKRLRSRSMLSIGISVACAFFFMQCEEAELTADKFSNPNIDAKAPGGGGKGGGEESVGNNLSFPVIWAEGTEKALRTPPTGIPEDGTLLEGEWWYVWGPEPIDPSSPIFSCQPSPVDEFLCIDQYDPSAEDNLSRAYLQKRALNYWQAYNTAATEKVYVDSIDWGDNLESVDWSITSRVRTEVVLYKVLDAVVTEYAMRHVSGWGADEVHGLETDLTGNIQYGDGNQATVFSPHARFTIQKLTSTTPNLTWDATTHSWTGDANEPVFNSAVYEAADGPGFYNAEVNVKGKIIYGYTWDVKKLHDGAGVYRLTFSFDEEDIKNNTILNTSLESAEIIQSEEEGEEEPGSGGTAVIDATHNLTYIDVTITSGGGGGGKGGNGSGGGKGGKNPS